MIRYEKQTERLRQIARQLLSEGSVPLVIGFCSNEESGAPTPFFARTPEDADLLIWSEDCWRNLSPYFIQTQGKFAFAAKPCDIRAAVNLMAENQLKREDLIIIGMECGAMKKDGLEAPGCAGCPSVLPVLCDYPIGADGSDRFTEVGSLSGESATEFATASAPGAVPPADPPSSPEERRARFQREIDRCILCFSCRQACPGCYCEVCFVDRNMTPWRQADADAAEKTAFHLTRAMHLAGRCVGCGACENVCPSGVSLKYLYDGINDFIKETYQFTPGLDPDAVQAMNYFRADDPEIGFLGGDGHDGD